MQALMSPCLAEVTQADIGFKDSRKGVHPIGVRSSHQHISFSALVTLTRIDYSPRKLQKKLFGVMQSFSSRRLH
jgi:hypothetical protein